VGVCEGFCWFDRGGGGADGVFLSGVLGWGGDVWGLWGGGREGVCECVACTRMCWMVEGAVWSCPFLLLGS